MYEQQTGNLTPAQNEVKQYLYFQLTFDLGALVLLLRRWFDISSPIYRCDVYESMSFKERQHTYLDDSLGCVVPSMTTCCLLHVQLFVFLFIGHWGCIFAISISWLFRTMKAETDNNVSCTYNTLATDCALCVAYAVFVRSSSVDRWRDMCVRLVLYLH